MRKEKVGEHTLTKQPLNSYKETVAHVFDLSRLYWKDLLEYKNVTFKVNGMLVKDLTPLQWFRYVQSLPYVKDPKRIEHVTRPGISLELAGTGHPLDCDDKSILSFSYFILQNEIKGYDYQKRAAVTGREDKPKHIYAEFKENRDSKIWIPYDCTYPHNVFAKTLYIPGFKRVFYEENHKVK